ncbi:hypothetical protein Tco_0154422 [Tanacetum coccineum]
MGGYGSIDRLFLIQIQGPHGRLDDEETSSSNYHFKRIYRRVTGFYALLDDDLQLQQGNGLTVVSDSHKVGDCLQHKKCTRHVFSNFKKKFSEVHLHRLFWHAASTTLEQNFYTKIEEMRVLSQEAYDYLIQMNPNSWCRAFFSLDYKCPNFENRICESFNTTIFV